MTKELLEQYPDICEEIKELSQTEAAATAENIELRAKLERQKKEIEAFVNGLDDSSLRRIIRLRVFETRSWDQVAAKMGYRHTKEAVRRRYERIFK